ncbi:uncharacterized protein LOC110882280 [Helianthus annuus]|uniref:uncharacterized protein LOC110882280 n=1 Tax=Helianthus annuus TaxID=4232 RepID=UPI000B9077C3|nr:uncharacterized protein LOC110882280 [Helianthus annuus]
MATKESITNNIVTDSDHIPVTKTEDSGIKITIVASEENHVETEAANNNVAVGSDTRHTNEKEDKEDGVASEDEHNEKQTGSDLSISMDKLNLGLKKKLIVLPITGFLVHRAFRFRQNAIPKNRMPDFCSGNFMIYKRPFCDEFLKFCFERFEVGIWSSAMEHNIGAVLTNVMGEHKSKLLFTWDQNQCTKTDFMCLDKKDKPVFLKELNHLWSKKYSNLPWCDGEYSASNTLLITDPVKTLMNPPNTSISPGNYDPENKEDNLLGPSGEIRVFLEGLAEAKDVQSYVKAHPIGDPAITSSHADWDYYSKIIRSFGKKESSDH